MPASQAGRRGFESRLPLHFFNQIAAFCQLAVRSYWSHAKKAWIHPQYSFFLPVGVLSRVFRGKFVAGLRKALAAGKLGFHGTLQPLAQPKVFSSFLRQFFGKDWVVYSKRPFGGPEHALRYLGRYTHRVGISNHRLVSFAGDKVHFALARLGTQKQEASHDPTRGGVPPALPAARIAERIRPHPALRFPEHPEPRAPPAPMFSASRRSLGAASPAHYPRSSRPRA